MLEDRGEHLVAGADLGDHLEVGLEAEQRGEGAAHQRLVVGEQQPDRPRRAPPAARSRGRAARSTTVAPTAAARSRRPARPEPEPRCRRGVAPAPSSRTSAAVGESATSQRRAPECRITLVTPSRTVQANSSRSSVGTSSAELGSSASISAAASAVRARASSPGRVSSR